MSDLNVPDVSPYPSEELWKKQPNDVYGHYLYIHRHVGNIGRMGGGDRENNASLIGIFQSYKQQSARAAKKQYVNYVANSMTGIRGGKLTGKEIQVIEEALNNENTGDKVLSRLHSVLQKSFEEQFDNSKIVSAMQRQSELNWSTKDNEYANVLDKYFQSNGMQGSPFVMLDNILQALEFTCQQLGSSYSKSLAVILSMQRRSFNNSNIFKNSKTRQLGENLNKALDTFEKNNNKGTLSKKELEEGETLLNLIRNLATTLEKNQTKTGEREGKFLSLRALQSLFQQNVFPGLSELFVNDSFLMAKNSLYEEIGATMNSIKQSGTDSSYMQAYDAEGNIIKNQYLKNVGVKEGTETKDYGKADQLVDTSVQLSRFIGKSRGQVKMSVGISQKAYVSKTIGQPLDKNYETFSLGKGLNLGQAFSLIPGLTLRHKYLGYNTIARDAKKSRLKGAISALQDVLLTRGITYLASGRGPGDSAQLLFINGNVMSMWDVIQYVMYNNVGASGSMLGKNISDDTHNGVYMHLADRKEIIRYAKDEEWRIRIENTNNAIESAVMQLEIIPKKIIDYASTLTK